MGNRRHPTFVAIGEILWDETPHGKFPGGAPFNTAVHLRQLGMPVRFISRVGGDPDGNELLSVLRLKGLSPEDIQIDPKHPTGRVTVHYTDAGHPGYQIHQPAAWDFIQIPNEDFRACFLIHGTLGLRHPVSRATIFHMRKIADQVVLDLNLRPPFDDKNLVLQSIEGADWLKVNEAEAFKLGNWLKIVGPLQTIAREILKIFALKGICITRAEKGAALLTAAGWLEQRAYPTNLQDAVGAGDAFLAGWLYGMAQEWAPEKQLQTANALGSWVAGRPGATPELPAKLVRSLQNGGIGEFFNVH